MHTQPAWLQAFSMSLPPPKDMSIDAHLNFDFDFLRILLSWQKDHEASLIASRLRKSLNGQISGQLPGVR